MNPISAKIKKAKELKKKTVHETTLKAKEKKKH